MQLYEKHEEDGWFWLSRKPGFVRPEYWGGSLGRGSSEWSARFPSEAERELYIVREDLRNAQAESQHLREVIAELKTLQGAGRAYRQALRAKADAV